MKHFSLMVPFVSYRENEVLLIRSQRMYSKHFLFYVVNGSDKLVVVQVKPFQPCEKKHSSLLGLFVSYK